jgi:type IX secretion system PorP/SprF family membrane protein
MNKIFTICFLLFTVLGLRAQDIHFSQYYASPLNLNPAMTGIFAGNFRLVGNYRTQWGSVSDNPYVTFAGSYDMRFDKGFVAHDNFGVGVNIFKDKAGDGAMSHTNFVVSGSYIKVLNRFKNQYLSFGGQLGLKRYAIDYSKLRFGSEYTGTGTEVFDNPSFSVANMNAGLMWYLIEKSGKSVTVGISANNINQANVSFQADNVERQDLRINGHVAANFPVSVKVDLIPSILFMKQGPHTEANIGFGVGYHIDKETKLTFNAWNRTGTSYLRKLFGDAFNLGLRCDYRNYGIGVSYDINFSDLDRGSNNRGSFELSLVYTDKAKSKHKTLNCPKF